MRLATRLLLTIFSAVLMLTVTAAAASADDEVVNQTSESVSTDACGNPEHVYTDSDHPATGTGQEVDITESASSMLLPVNRWGDATSTFYSNLDEGGWLSLELRQQSREQIAGFFYSASSTVWEGTVATSVWATAFCPIGAVGHQIDSFLGTMGDTLLGAGQPLIIALLVTLVAVAAWGSRKGTGFAMNWKGFFGKISIITLFYFMVTGAQDSTMEGGDWNPSGLSPGNIVTTTNTLISDLGGLTTEGMMNISQDGSYAQLDWDAGSQTTDCRAAIGSMHGAYQQSFDGPEHQGLASQIPVAISDSWVNSVYVSYSRAQQGPYRPGDDGTAEGENASPHHYSTCYILDWSSPTPIIVGGEEFDSDSNRAFVGRPMGGYFQQGHSEAFDATGSDGLTSEVDGEERWKGILAPQTTMGGVQNTTNSALAFWSVCRVADNDSVSDMTQSGDTGDWVIADGFQDSIWASEGCAEWYAGDLADDGQVEGGSLEDLGMPGFPDNTEDVLALGLGEYETQYINYVNGLNPMGAIGTGFITLVTSLMLFVIFGALGLIVVVARAALLVVMIYLFATAIVALFPGQGFKAVLKAFKMLVGVVMISAFAQVLYSLIIGMSTALNGVGAQFLDFGSVGYVGWIAITPLLALLGVHVVFKWAKLPSPFTAKGAMAWGKGMGKEGASASGGAFGGSGAGGSMSPRRAASNVSKGYRDASVNRAVDRSGSREGQMEAAGREAQRSSSTGSAGGGRGRGRIGNMVAGYGAGGVAGAVGGFAGGGKGKNQTGAGGGKSDSEETTATDTSVGGGGAKGAKQRAQDTVMDDQNFEGSNAQQKQVAQEAGKQAKAQYRSDAAETRKANRAAKRREFKDKYLATKPGSDGKRRIAVGGSLNKLAGTGLQAIRDRGLKGNLKTAAKVAGVGAVATGFGAVPAAAIAGAWGAKKFGGSLAGKANRGLAAHGLGGTKAARDQFAGEVGAYVGGGRKATAGGEHAARTVSRKVAEAGGSGAKWASEANQRRRQRGEENRATMREADDKAKRDKEVGRLTDMGISEDRAARVVDRKTDAQHLQESTRAEATQRARNVAGLRREDQRADRQDQMLTRQAEKQLRDRQDGSLSDPQKVAEQKQKIQADQEKKEAERTQRRNQSQQEKDADKAKITSKASQYVGANAAAKTASVTGAGVGGGAGDPEQFFDQGGKPDQNETGGESSPGPDNGGGQPVEPQPSDSGGSGGAAGAPESGGGGGPAKPLDEGDGGAFNSGGDGPNPQ